MHITFISRSLWIRLIASQTIRSSEFHSECMSTDEQAIADRWHDILTIQIGRPEGNDAFILRALRTWM